MGRCARCGAFLARGRQARQLLDMQAQLARFGLADPVSLPPTPQQRERD